MKIKKAFGAITCILILFLMCACIAEEPKPKPQDNCALCGKMTTNCISGTKGPLEQLGIDISEAVCISGGIYKAFLCEKCMDNRTASTWW